MGLAFSNLKKIHHYNHEDLVIKFYNGVLSATKDGLTNLFCAGAHVDDPYPLACIVSLKYLDWAILEEKYSYEVQKHSILHLIICGIIGAYSRLEAHSDIGCLLDMNLSLTSFNLKLITCKSWSGESGAAFATVVKAKRTVAAIVGIDFIRTPC